MLTCLNRDRSIKRRENDRGDNPTPRYIAAKPTYRKRAKASGPRQYTTHEEPEKLVVD